MYDRPHREPKAMTLCRPSDAMAGLARRAPGQGQACPARKGPGDAPRPLDYVPSSQTLTASKVIRLSDENVCCKRREICLWSLWFSSKFVVIGFSRHSLYPYLDPSVAADARRCFVLRSPPLYDCRRSKTTADATSLGRWTCAEGGISSRSGYLADLAWFLRKPGDLLQ